MAINKKLISFATQAQFDVKLNAGDIDNRSIVFIEDKKRIWTHGVFFDTSWNYITGTPDTLAGYNITDAASKINSLYYVVGNTTGTAGAWVGSVSEVTSLYEGLTIAYRIGVAGASTTNLNLNGLGNKLVRRATGNLTTHLPVGTIVLLTYNGTNWVWADYDSNTTYAAMSVVEGTTGTATSLRTVRADYLKQIIEHHITNTVPSAHTLASHSDVTITSNSNGEILKWNGTSWINNTLSEAGIASTGQLNNYLPLSGGTLTSSSYNILELKRSSANGSSLLFSNSSVNLGKIGFIASGNLVVGTGTSTDGTANMLSITPAGVSTFYNSVTAPTFIGALTGNASSATKLQTARTIAGVSFDGTANINIPFANLSSKPNTLGGYDITDAYTKTEVNSLASYVGAYSFPNGFLVKTNIARTENSMLVLHIKGNSYGSAVPIDTFVQLYNYVTNDALISTGALNNGYKINEVKAFYYNNLVYFWVPQQSGSQTMHFQLLKATGQVNRVDSVTNAAVPTSGVEKMVTIIPRTSWFENTLTNLSQLTDNIGVATHIANKSNPHSVTKAQVGLGNVTNESKATMFTNPTFTGLTKGAHFIVGYDWATKRNGLQIGVDGIESGISFYNGTSPSASIYREGENFYVGVRGGQFTKGLNILSSGVVEATTFSGNLTGNVTGNITGSAGSTTNWAGNTYANSNITNEVYLMTSTNGTVWRRTLASRFSGSEHTHNYLPLTGGILTGDIQYGTDTGNGSYFFGTTSGTNGYGSWMTQNIKKVNGVLVKPRGTLSSKALTINYHKGMSLFVDNRTGLAHGVAAELTQVFNVSTAGVITAASFSGNINASNLNTGTVPNARITGTYTGLTNLTGTGNIDFARFIGNAGDTVAAPSITWTGDLNTGIYRPAATQVAITTGGVQRALFSSAGITGTLVGNASTATKLASITTTFTGTYPVTFNVNGTIYSHTGITYTGNTGELKATTFVGALTGLASLNLPLTGGTLGNTAKLEIRNNSAGISNVLQLTNTSSSGRQGTSIFFKGYFNQALISSSQIPSAIQGGDLHLQTYSTDSVLNTGIYLDRTGKVGINTITPSYNLDVSGTGRFTGNVTGTGFSKTGATDAHVLLGSGGHKSISDFNASLVTSTTTSGTTNVATSNTNTYLNIVQGGSSVGSSTQIVGSNGVTVASDTTGKLTITGLGAHAGAYSSRANGLGASSNSIEIRDTRSINPLPNTDLQRGAWFDFKTSSAIGLAGASTYSSVITMVPYGDNSGNSNASFRLAQSGNNLYFQNWTTVWGTWNKLWHSGNLANGTTNQYIRGDGSLATYSDTTYSEITEAQTVSTSSSVVGLITGRRLKYVFDNITAANATTATNATNTININTLADNSTNADRFILFSDAATGNQRAKTDTGLKYNPSSNTITATLAGNASSATTASSANLLKSVNENTITSVPLGTMSLNRFSSSTSGSMPTNSNANAALTINTHSGNYHHQLGFSSNGRLYHRVFSNEALNDTKAWGSLAFLTDNVASATKLQTVRTIWGQNFDGTGNVSGAITGTTTIAASTSVTAPKFISSTNTGGLITPIGTGWSQIWGMEGYELTNATTPNSNFYGIATQYFAPTRHIGFFGAGVENAWIGLHDGSAKFQGNVTAPTFVGALSGNASSASAVTLTADNTTNATRYPLFVDAATGNKSPRTDTGFTYNPSTGALTTSTFIGELTGNVTGGIATNNGIEYLTTLATTISAIGWYRVFVSNINNGGGSSVILNVNRNYSVTNNESYTFSINVAYSGAISITQLSGRAHTRIISKIRVDYVNSGVLAVDIYYSLSNSNRVYISGSGTGKFQAPTLVAAPTGTTVEFDTVNGVKNNLGFTGDLTGNASSATKLGTATVGSTQLPFYLNAGTATAITRANLRIGLFGATAIGSTTRPIYIAANGVPTAITGSIANSTTGNAATATNISNSGTVTLATATESNSISIGQPSYVSGKPVKLLNFNWYTTAWSLGNIRGGSTDSQGLGVYLNGVEKFRFSDGSLKVGSNTVYHEGNLSPVTLNTTQTITGDKTFNANITLGINKYIQGTDAYTGVWNVNDLLWRFGSSKAGSIANIRSEKVGIGTDSPLYKLDVSGDGRFTGDVIAPTFIGALNGKITTTEGTLGSMKIQSNMLVSSSEKLSIDGTSSTITLKDASTDAVRIILKPDNLPTSPSTFFGSTTKSASFTAMKTTLAINGATVSSNTISVGANESYSFNIPSVTLTASVLVPEMGGGPQKIAASIFAEFYLTDGMVEVPIGSAFAMSFFAGSQEIKPIPATTRTITSPGSWRLRFRCTLSLGGFSSSEVSAYVKLESSSSTFSATPIVNRSEFGSNGLIVATSSNQYDFMVGNTFEVRRQNQMLRATSSDIQVSKNGGGRWSSLHSGVLGVVHFTLSGGITYQWTKDGSTITLSNTTSNPFRVNHNLGHTNYFAIPSASAKYGYLVPENRYANYCTFSKSEIDNGHRLTVLIVGNG